MRASLNWTFHVILHALSDRDFCGCCSNMLISNPQ
jgi:hypothetical protein